MAIQKRAINGSSFTFDPMVVKGQAEEMTATAAAIARHRR